MWKSVLEEKTGGVSQRNTFIHVCSREQVSHTRDGSGLQANPKDECRREGACSAEVMFILKWMVG